MPGVMRRYIRANKAGDVPVRWGDGIEWTAEIIWGAPLGQARTAHVRPARVVGGAGQGLAGLCLACCASLIGGKGTAEPVEGDAGVGGTAEPDGASTVAQW